MTPGFSRRDAVVAARVLLQPTSDRWRHSGLFSLSHVGLRVPRERRRRSPHVGFAPMGGSAIVAGYLEREEEGHGVGLPRGRRVAAVGRVAERRAAGAHTVHTPAPCAKGAQEQSPPNEVSAVVPASQSHGVRSWMRVSRWRKRCLDPLVGASQRCRALLRSGPPATSAHPSAGLSRTECARLRFRGRDR